MIQCDLGLTEKLYPRQNRILATRTFSCTRHPFVLVFGAKFDAASDLKRHLIQLSCIEPKASAFLAHVVGQFGFFRSDIIVHHLGFTVQTAHGLIPLGYNWIGTIAALYTLSVLSPASGAMRLRSCKNSESIREQAAGRI